MKWFEQVILLEFIIGMIMLVIGHLLVDKYFSGVGVGLTISWVTGAIARWRVGSKK